MGKIKTKIGVFTRIILPDGRYLLAINSGKLAETGEAQLGPLGGNQQYNPDYQEEMANLLGIDLNTGFERPNDLRLILREENKEALIDLIIKDSKFVEPRKDAVYRELIEELYTEELTTIPGLTTDVEKMFWTKPEFIATTFEPGLMITRTIFNITLPDEKPVQRILQALRNPEIGLYALSKEEILDFYNNNRLKTINFKDEIYEVSLNMTCRYMLDELIPKTDLVHFFHK
jgi:hypothetical protein